MGLLLGTVVDEGFVRVVDVLVSTVGMMVALWFVVRWNPTR